MQYNLIQPPSLKPAYVMTRKEAGIYFRWYIDQIPERITGLQRAIRSTAGKPQFRSWEADLTPESLPVLLGQWFSENLYTAPPSEEFKRKRLESLEKIPEKYRAMFSMPEFVFMDLTYSLICDLGIYLGETIRKRFPYVEWQLWTKKRYVYSNKPVLAGFKKRVEYDPENHIEVYALNLVEKRCQPSDLYDLFDTCVYMETEW
jgi:hypothetical protein